MQIDFYEEFPTKENLEKLKLVKFPIRLFVAARSINEFKKLEKEIKRIKKDVTVAYWPIIPDSYYISAFSKTEELVSLFKELNNIKNQILIDLEIPLKKHFFLKILNVRKNKKIISEFLEKNKDRITAPTQPFLSERIRKFFGTDYDISYEKNPMYYSSMNQERMNKIIKRILLGVKNKGNYSIGLGTIAVGILGNEPNLSPENLEKDLEFVKRSGFKKVIIFRLGGLNKNYIKVINKFQKR